MIRKSFCLVFKGDVDGEWGLGMWWIGYNR